jgi:hypothetical protein
VTAIRTYAEQVDRAFLPRPQGPQPAIVAGGDGPALEAAFGAFRRILTGRGVNLAAIAPRPLEAGLWAAIRAGWREGYNAEAEPLEASSARAEEVERAAGQIARSAGYSKYVVDASRLFAAGEGEGIRACERYYDAIRSARAAAGAGRAFDFEVGAGAVTPETMGQILHALRARGRAAQAIGVPFDPDRIGEMAGVARSMNAALSCDAAGLEPGQLAHLAAHWRVCVRMGSASPEWIEWLAGQFRG